MAKIEAWTDRTTMISLFQDLQGCLDNHIIYAKEAEKFKLEVLDDPVRKAEMKKLIIEDPNWTLAKITSKYNKFKTIYEYLESL